MVDAERFICFQTGFPLALKDAIGSHATTADYGTVNLSQIPSAASLITGQGVLALSGANLVLSPFNGNVIAINSAAQIIPDAGVSLGVGGLAASTTYYIYAYISGSTMTLEASTTTHATQAGTGIEIKSGDATRSLVGMARTTSGTAWASSSTQRFVRSWFNDPALEISSQLTSDITAVAPVNYVEMTTSLRIEILVWTNDVVNIGLGVIEVPVGGNAACYFAIGFNGTTAEDPSSDEDLVSTAVAGRFTCTNKRGLTEGYNYIAFLGKCNVNNLQWRGSATAGIRSASSGFIHRGVN